MFNMFEAMEKAGFATIVAETPVQVGEMHFKVSDDLARQLGDIIIAAMSKKDGSVVVTTATAATAATTTAPTTGNGGLGLEKSTGKSTGSTGKVGGITRATKPKYAMVEADKDITQWIVWDDTNHTIHTKAVVINDSAVNIPADAWNCTKAVLKNLGFTWDKDSKVWVAPKPTTGKWTKKAWTELKGSIPMIVPKDALNEERNRWNENAAKKAAK